MVMTQCQKKTVISRTQLWQQTLKWRGLLPVELIACNLDQGQPGFPATVLPKFLTKMGVKHRIEYQDTYSIVMDKIPAGHTFCSLC